MKDGSEEPQGVRGSVSRRPEWPSATLGNRATC